MAEFDDESDPDAPPAPWSPTREAAPAHDAMDEVCLAPKSDDAMIG
jgi:hypothetical protein